MYSVHLGTTVARSKQRVPSLLRAVLRPQWTLSNKDGPGIGKRRLGVESTLGSVREAQAPLPYREQQPNVLQLHFVDYLERARSVGEQDPLILLQDLAAARHRLSPLQSSPVPLTIHPALRSEAEFLDANPILPPLRFDGSITLTPTSPLCRASLMPRGSIEIEDKAKKLEKLELELEKSTYDEAIANYKDIQDTLFETGKGTSLHRVQRVMLKWYEPLTAAIQKQLDYLKNGDWDSLAGAGTYGPFLQLLDAQKLAVIVMHETVNHCIKVGNEGVPLVRLLVQIGEAVQMEVNCLKLQDKYGQSVLQRLREDGALSIKRINKAAKRALEDGYWNNELKMQVGSTLLRELMEVAKVTEETAGMTAKEEETPKVFTHDKQHVRGYKKQGVIFMDDEVYRKMTEVDEDLGVFLAPRFRPMVVEPSEWRSYDTGGYRQLKTYLVRSHGSRLQLDALKDANMPQVYEALNFLGKVKWTLNEEVYEVVKEAWKSKSAIAELPDQDDMPIPLPDYMELEGVEKTEENASLFDQEIKKKWEYKQLVKRIRKRNSELYSLRCDTNIKLAIADQFIGKEFFFPYNLDFRGRAYPIPPNLNHLGSDLCRGILSFAEKKPLGENGLRWLKIQLANLFGQDKVSFDGRVEWVDNMMEEVYDSAKKPLKGKGWWMKADEPWQALATCKEIVAALDSGDPAMFCSGLPVHMDGSCNGLQHYAALGRDEQGAKQVNLIRASEPQDVYTGVCELVIKHVAEEARTPPPEDASETQRRNHKYAKLVDGMIDRKVVKQTVMTSVYGVTYIGARKQIQARLQEKFEAGLEDGMLTQEQENDVYQAARYVAAVTLSKLAELFSSARHIMTWLSTCSSLVASQGQPMSWVTPLGLPVIQPYRRETGHQVRTLLQTIVLVDCNDNLPVSSQRQRSAFPPNFVHSLDSTHMLLTAIELKKKGIPFTAVHDSYWSHAGNVEVMNETLRQCFVDLYQRPILETLRESLVARYPDIDFPEIPDRGNLDLHQVLDSPYFFD